MSYDDAHHAEADYLSNIDATTLFEWGLLPDPGEYCPHCEMTRPVSEDVIEGSTDILRICDECEHQWRVSTDREPPEPEIDDSIDHHFEELDTLPE